MMVVYEEDEWNAVVVVVVVVVRYVLTSHTFLEILNLIALLSYNNNRMP